MSNDKGRSLVTLFPVLLMGLIICVVASAQGNRGQSRPGSRSSSAPADAPPSNQTKEGWLSAAEVPHDTVTAALNAVGTLTAPDAAKEVEAYRVARGAASDEGKRAADLIIAAALEHANDLSNATVAYTRVVSEAAGTPYAASAAFRLRIIDQPDRTSEDSEKLYEKIVEGPEVEGWFLVSNQWAWTTTRRAAWQSLINLRSNHLSFRLFSFLRSKSLFPTPYAYLFVLLAIGVGIKILALPLYVRGAKLAGQLRDLQSEMQSIQRIYADDPATMQQRLSELYKARGVNPVSGCAVGLVDLTFVIWALVALSSFAPQLALDGARFWWISDVSKRDFSILIVWAVIAMIGGLQTAGQQQQSTGQLVGGMLVFSTIIMIIAWYWQWPAYILIFWILLNLLGMVMYILLTPIRTARK